MKKKTVERTFAFLHLGLALWFLHYAKSAESFADAATAQFAVTICTYMFLSGLDKATAMKEDE